MTMQPVAALPVDAEEWWIVYLRGALVGRTEPYATGVKFDRKIPNPRPSRLVVISRDGGALSGVFDFPRVRIDVWHEDSALGQKYASDLSRLLIALAMDAPGTNGCVRVTHQSGPNDVPDPSGQPRRLSLIEAKHRANILAT